MRFCSRSVLLGTLALSLSTAGVVLSCLECEHAHGCGIPCLPVCAGPYVGAWIPEFTFDGWCTVSSSGSCEPHAGQKWVTPRKYLCILPYHWIQVGYDDPVLKDDCKDL